jgi:hypothetical protein
MSYQSIDDMPPEDQERAREQMKSMNPMLLDFTHVPAKKIHDALTKALKDSERKQAGCGATEFTVDGFALYDRIKGIRDTLV